MEGGGSAHSLVIMVLVMSHKERVGDRMRHRDKEKLESRVRRAGEACLHYFQVSPHIVRRLTYFCRLTMNLPALCSSARVPLIHLSAAHVHSEQAQSQILISIQVKGQINKHPAMNIMWQFNSLCLNQNTNSPALFFYIWGNSIRHLGTYLILF